MDKWQSKSLYQHPAPHQRGTYGLVCLASAEIYYLRVGASIITCPQDWASKIHVEENITILREACKAEGTLFTVVKVEAQDALETVMLMEGMSQEEIEGLRAEVEE